MATIHDVARQAEVSIKTVSRVLNKSSQVRPETRAAVEQAMEVLDYTPHGGARSMRSKRSGLVAMITSGIFAEGWIPYRTGLTSIPILHGAQKTFRTAGKTLLFADAQGAPDEIAELVRAFHAHRVEGLVYSTYHHKEVSLDLNLPFPLVLVNCFDAAGTPAVVPDDEAAQRLVVREMLADGHSSIAMIGLPRTLVAGQQRHSGFLDEARAAGLSGECVHFAEGLELEGVREINVLPKAIDAVTSSGRPPTAICFGNDLMAMRALPVMARKGLNAGRDIAVWGFDNDLTICESVVPRLSTISLPYYEMGVAAAECLLAIMESGHNPHSVRKICGDIVRRDSSPFSRPRLAAS